MCPTDDAAKAPTRATLEITGEPGQLLSIVVASPWDAPSRPIFEGALPAGGCIRLRVPRSRLLIVAAGREHATVQFDHDDELRCIDLRHPH